MATSTKWATFFCLRRLKYFSPFCCRLFRSPTAGIFVICVHFRSAQAILLHGVIIWFFGRASPARGRDTRSGGDAKITAGLHLGIILFSKIPFGRCLIQLQSIKALGNLNSQFTDHGFEIVAAVAVENNGLWIPKRSSTPPHPVISGRSCSDYSLMSSLTPNCPVWTPREWRQHDPLLLLSRQAWPLRRHVRLQDVGTRREGGSCGLRWRQNSSW